MMYKSFWLLLGRLCCFQVVCVVEVESVDQVVHIALTVAK